MSKAATVARIWDPVSLKYRAIPAGGSGEGEGAGQSGDGSDGDGTGATGSDQGGSGDVGTGQGDGSQGKGSGTAGEGLDEAGLRAELERARKEAAKYRTERNAERDKIGQMESQLAGIQKALGIETEQADPEALQAKLSERDSQLRDLKVGMELRDIAGKHQADLPLLEAVLRSKGKLNGLDPESQSFAQDLEGLVTEAINGNPKLKASVQGTGSSGADFTGGSGEGKVFSRDDIRNMDAATYEKNQEEIHRQMREGLIK